MKIKDNLVLRQVADTWVVLPLSNAIVTLNGILNLNESGAVLWRTLEQGATREQMVDVLMAEYDVSKDIAQSDVDEFIETLLDANCLEIP